MVSSNLHRQGDRGQPRVSSYCELWQWPANKAIVVCVYMFMNIMMELNQKLSKRMPRGHSLQGVYMRKTYLYNYARNLGKGIYLKSTYFQELAVLDTPICPSLLVLHLSEKTSGGWT